MGKEENILVLFFNEPTRHWHFEIILKEAKISRPQASLWIKKFLKNKLIKRIKHKGEMPYYIADTQSANYQNTKKIFALNKFHESGLLNYLSSLDKIKTVVVFGSFSRWDWYKESDIDIFLYGDDKNHDIGKFQFKLHREIELFSARNKKELKKLKPGLISNIIKGIVIKGSIPQEMINYAYIEE